MSTFNVLVEVRGTIWVSVEADSDRDARHEALVEIDGADLAELEIIDSSVLNVEREDDDDDE